MAQTAVIVTGVARLDRKLSTMEPRLQKKGVRKALRSAAKNVVKPDAIARHSQKTETSSGETERSTKVRATRRSRSRMGIAVVAGGPRNESAWWAKFVELGTQYQEPQGAYREALYENEHEIKGVFIDALRDWIFSETSL